MDEFSLIRDHFAPLARGFSGSLALTDDAALIAPPKKHELVVTTDAIVSGVHFIGNEDAALVAKKLLRVNLSDIAAKGATPFCYFLTLILPADTQEDWVKRFAEGLTEDQKEFAIHLAGGDTTASHGPLSLSLTAIGSVKKGGMLTRRGAKAGDDIYVSGTLGDSALGLKLLKASKPTTSFLAQRYLLPQPRLALGTALRGIASSAMDVSDGLAQDLGHICNASNVGAQIMMHLLPTSEAAQTLVTEKAALQAIAASAGDDYELLFTAAPKKAKAIAALSEKLQLPLTKIGSIEKETGVRLFDEAGRPVSLAKKGFRHFA